MMFSVVVGEKMARKTMDHLLQHARKGKRGEEILFGTYTESTGRQRRTAVLNEVIWPKAGDTRETEDGTKAEKGYLSRAARQCEREGKGLFMIHNHLTPGWHTLSRIDRETEQRRVANVARITGKPLVGLTAGTDETLSARWWTRPWGNREEAKLEWCDTVRVAGESRLRVDHVPRRERYGKGRSRERYRRRIETWGEATQESLGKIRVGLVGAGSVGMLIAEGLGRIGVRNLTIIDPDRVEPHNLDRLVGGSEDWIGGKKAEIAERVARRALGEAEDNIQGHIDTVESRTGWELLLDCDVAFTSVDSAIARDVANHAGVGHGIPIIEGGVRVERGRNGRLARAHYVAGWTTAETACLRCMGQYTTGDIGTERKERHTPGYVVAGPRNGSGGGNVFVFAMGCAQQQLEIFIRNVVGESWWNHPSFVRKQVTTGSQHMTKSMCQEGCYMKAKKDAGNEAKPPYL